MICRTRAYSSPIIMFQENPIACFGFKQRGVIGFESRPTCWAVMCWTPIWSWTNHDVLRELPPHFRFQNGLGEGAPYSAKPWRQAQLQVPPFPSHKLAGPRWLICSPLEVESYCLMTFRTNQNDEEVLPPHLWFHFNLRAQTMVWSIHDAEPWY